MNAVHKIIDKGDQMPKILTNVKPDIYKATKQMLNQDGYDKLSIRGIAKECGIGMGTIYNYFKSKDEIIIEIVLDDWNMVLKRMDNVIESDKSVMEKLTIVYKQLNEFVSGYHGMWLDMMMSGSKPPSGECRRASYTLELLERISIITSKIESDMDDKEIDFLNNTITTLFLSNTKDGDLDLLSLEKFLNRITK